jgi:hypothetical protein
MCTDRDIVIHTVPDPVRTEREAFLVVGQWYWVKRDVNDADDDDDDADVWLGCITTIGSNYAELTSVHEGYTRVHFDEFDAQCTLEPDPDRVFQGQIDKYQAQAKALMEEIHALTAQLGIAPRAELYNTSDEQSQALVVAHGTKDAQEYKEALIKAQKKTLPDLFQKVKETHEQLARWMQGKLIPMRATTTQLKEQTKRIEDRIFTVELYAGLVESLVQVCEGAPASNDTKLHLHQRRHYMDEECLLDYKAGGMEFKDLKAFDRWLGKKKNFNRILPFPRSLVAFRVRRDQKEHTFTSLYSFIRFLLKDDLDKKTFLYLRNGEQLWRLETGIDFGKRLFPDKALSTTLGTGELWFKEFAGRVDEIISDAAHQGLLEDQKQAKKEYKAELAAWNKLSKQEQDGRCKPYYYEPHDRWEKLTPDSVYYDDACRKIAAEAMQHNRVAVVLQGILDRSPALHPHPPWQLWTPEGFTNALELHYDQTRALTSGAAPDFEAYRAKLNASIRRGSTTVGQDDAWERAMAEKYNEEHKWSDKQYHTPHGNPGPGLVATVTKLSHDKKRATFEWLRERRSYQRWGNRGDIKTRFTCAVSDLLNVDAYQPGDFLQFYSDPRTRAQYLKWAPLLLTAENYKAKMKT